MKAIQFRSMDDVTEDWINYLVGQAIRASYRSSEELDAEIDALSNNPDIQELLTKGTNPDDVYQIIEGFNLDDSDMRMNYLTMLDLDAKGKKIRWLKLKKRLRAIICEVLREHMGDNPKVIIRKAIEAIIKALKGNVPGAIVSMVVIILAKVFKLGMPKWCPKI